MNLAFADRDFYYGDTCIRRRQNREGTAVEGIRKATCGDDPAERQ